MNKRNLVIVLTLYAALLATVFVVQRHFGLSKVFDLVAWWAIYVLALVVERRWLRVGAK